MQRDDRERESGFTRSIIDELYSSNIQGDEMEGESGVSQSIIEEFHYWDLQGDQMEAESIVVLQVSSINFILEISKDIKRKV